MAIEFRVLGPLELSADGRVLPLGGLKQRALLGLLLVHANETLSRDRLIDELWGESPPATVESALQVYLSRLRKLLDGAGAGGALVHEPWGYSLRVGREELDLSRFERLVGEGREALAAGDPGRAAGRLRAGLGLWRGPPLADLQSERFAIDAAARWEEERVVALEQRLEADLALGRDQELVGELETLVADHPYRERLRAQLMLALYRCGRQVEALEAYQQARQILAAELGLEPGQELRQLERAILANDPELAVKPRLQQAESAPEAAVAAPIEERKVVTVLVAAVRVMHDVAALDPEDLRAVQERHLNLVRPAVEQHGGTVESVTGNSVTAVFGAPRVHEDDPERAVRTALAIRDEAARTRLEVGIGVATGEALVQHEADSSAGARVVGSIVEIAARLAADGREGHVLAAERTYHATTSVVEYREQEPRDGTTAIRAWEALAAPSQPRAPETGGQRSSPFVGRERELALLVAALARVREQWEPELVTLVGAPGIGKTRVVEELRRSAEDRADPEVAWLQGRSLPYGDGVSFWALAEIVKAQAGILESDTDSQVEKKLQRVVDEVLRDERETAWVYQHLRPLLGVAQGHAAGDGDRDEAFAAWRRFFEALAERRPLVVVFEDLHWADETLLDFVEGLAEWIGAAPLLVVGTGRPELLERRPQWGGGKQNAFTISLGPLSDTDSARLLSALLQRLRPGVETDASLLAKIGGNPFFAEQYARAVDEQAQTRELPLPDSVQAMIAARLDMLPAGEKSLLQDAAVIGKTFWAGAAAALDGLDRSAADERLRLLEHKQFVQHAVHSAVAGETEYAFRHLLLRDVAYAQIPRAVRAAKHQAGAAWIESLGRPHDHAEALAHHYECALKLSKASGADIAEIAPRARLALRDAGERTFALNAPAAAAGYFERALELWPEDDRDRPRLLFRYAEALHATGDARQEQMLMRAREANVMAGDVDTAAEADALLAKMWWLIAGREGVDRHLERAARLIHGRPTSASKARVLAQLAHLHYFALMDSKEAIRVGSEALTLCDRLGLPQLQADVLITVGMARQNTPDYAAGIGEVEQGLELALASNALTAARRGYFNLAGLIMVFRGDLARHDELLHEAELLDERLGDIRSVRRTKWIRLSTNTFWRGDWDEVLQFADEFIAECEAGKPDALESSARAMRATICLARDDVEGALADCEKAIPHARRIAMSDATLVVLAVCAMIYVELGRVDEARSLTDEILSHDSDTVRFVTPWLALNAEALGTHAEVQTLLARFRSENPWLPCMRLILDGCYELAADELVRIGDASDAASLRLRAGRALASEGRADEAKAQLQEALAFYRSVGATRYIRRTETLLAAAREAPDVAAEAPR